MPEPEITSLQVVSLQPGDCLVVRIAPRLSPPAMTDLRQRIQAQIPPDVGLLILDDGMQLDVLRPNTLHG